MFSALLCVVASAASARAAVKLGSPFVDRAVLQRGQPVPVWGTADAGAAVTVALGVRRATATADAAGRWSTALDPLPAGGPLRLSAAAGGATATAADVLVGDVFLCSGQSNMQFAVRELDGADAAVADPPPQLRLGKVGVAWTAEPQDRCDVRWSAAAPADARAFSAVAYCFARELYRQDPKLAGVPVGVLADCQGATVIESWMPKATLAEFDPKTLQSSMFGIGPTLLYNGMVAPLGDTRFAGVVWYQGEGNAGQPARYRQYLPLMMRSWRTQLKQPDLPFLVVQLPDYAPDWGGVYWQWIREAEAKACDATPHAAYAVGIETNDGWNLHPQGKRELGRRLAMLAREVVYHDAVAGRSPTFKSAAVDGDAIRVTFDTDGSTLTSGTRPVDGFSLAGADGVYHGATGAIAGADTVVVRSAEVQYPATVRYAWAGVPRSTLASAAGLPAAPFRTDDQPVASGGELQQAAAGFEFKGVHYRLAIDGSGRATSLVVRNRQLLSNAPTPWGGSNLAGPGGNYSLSHLWPDGPNRLDGSAGDVAESVRFDPDAIHWTVSNRGSKGAVRFTIALAPAVTADGGDGKPVELRRPGAAVRVTGADRVTAFTDVAADAGAKVLEVTVPPGESRTVDLSVNP